MPIDSRDEGREMVFSAEQWPNVDRAIRTSLESDGKLTTARPEKPKKAVSPMDSREDGIQIDFRA
jgi:hypothetical protein